MKNLKKFKKIIDEIASSNHTLLNTSGELKDCTKNELFSNTNLDNWNFTEAETFYSKDFLNKLTRLLGDSSSFKKKNIIYRTKIQHEIELLSHYAHNTKAYLHESVGKSNYFCNMFPKEFKMFKCAFKVLFVNRNTERGYSHRIDFKFKDYYSMLIDRLIKDGFDLKFILPITEADLESIFDKYLTANLIFDKLCIITSESTFRKALFDSKILSDEGFMCIERHKIIYSVYDYFTILFVLEAIRYKLSEKSEVNNLLPAIHYYIVTNRAKLELVNEYKSFVDGITSIWNAYANSNIFKISTKKEGVVTFVVYHLPTLLSDQICSFTQLPRVVRPEKVTLKTLENYVKRWSTSSIQISQGESIVRSLNISNNKPFTINTNFLKILNSIEAECDFSENLPIASRNAIRVLSEKVDLDNISSDKFHEKLRKLRVIRRINITRLVSSKILVGFPLYFTNSLATTTRSFAREYLLSRHIGCLKLLRCEHTSTKVTLKGMEHMLKSYYSDDLLLLNKFEKYLKRSRDRIKGKLNMKVFESFYVNNQIDYSKKEAITHFMLISIELRSVFKTGKSRLLLQLDQVASGLVFMAILFKNKALAIQTNVHSVEGTISPYNYAMDNFEKFYEQNIQRKSDKVLRLCKTSRKLHKYALMCYSYNQTRYGRTQDFKERWDAEYGIPLKQSDWECLHEVAKKYPSFIDSLFPGLNRHIILLNGILNLVIKDCGFLRFKTLDDAIIEWRFFKKKKAIRKALNPHTMVIRNYGVNLVVAGSDNEPAVDYSQYQVKFLSYLVHSLDAAIMRQIICGDELKNHPQRVVSNLINCFYVINGRYLQIFQYPRVSKDPEKNGKRQTVCLRLLLCSLNIV